MTAEENTAWLTEADGSLSAIDLERHRHTVVEMIGRLCDIREDQSQQELMRIAAEHSLAYAQLVAEDTLTGFIRTVIYTDEVNGINTATGFRRAHGFALCASNLPSTLQQSRKEQTRE